MTAGYCATLLVTFLTLAVLALLVHANGRTSKEDKQRYYQICIVIMLAGLWEWFSIFLNGAADWTVGLHKLAKALDYIFTPVCSVLFIRQVAPRERGWKPMTIVLSANTALQVLSIFTGWTFYVDAQNYYRHGPLHFLYTGVTVLALLFVTYAFREYGKKYERQNQAPLYGIFLLVAVCIILQGTLGDEGRVAYLGMAIGSCMLFIHHTEFQQIEQDAVVREQDMLLTIDALTGVLSRFAYKQVSADYAAQPQLPEWLTAFETDLNGLKDVNDLLGHEAGDELLRGAGAVLCQVIASNGQVFRIGGDEFVILLDTRRLSASDAVRLLRDAAAAWTGTRGETLSLSIGFASASEFPHHTLADLVHEADQRMYADKDAYYRQPGHERRRGPRGCADGE